MKPDPWWMKIKLSESYGPKGPIMKWWVRPACIAISIIFGTIMYILKT